MDNPFCAEQHRRGRWWFRVDGFSIVYGDEGREPYHSINFITVHDGFTLYDLVSYADKQNECGLLNPNVAMTRSVYGAIQNQGKNTIEATTGVASP